SSSPLRSDAPLVPKRAHAVRNLRVAGRAAYERLELCLPRQGARRGDCRGGDAAHRDRDRAANRTALNKDAGPTPTDDLYFRRLPLVLCPSRRLERDQQILNEIVRMLQAA